MEQIARNNGVLYYGKQICRDANDAYLCFRDDYHASLGKAVYRRLNMPDREERIHGFKVYFSDSIQRELDSEFGVPSGRIQCRLIGLVGISYCRDVDVSGFPDYNDDKFGRWFDWFLSHAHEMMRLVGTNVKAGRTSKNLNRRYR